MMNQDLNELQVLWLKEMGVTALWGTPLKATHLNPKDKTTSDSSLETVSQQTTASESLSTTHTEAMMVERDAQQTLSELVAASKLGELTSPDSSTRTIISNKNRASLNANDVMESANQRASVSPVLEKRVYLVDELAPNFLEFKSRTLAELEEKIQLHQLQGNTFMFGQGHPSADLMIVDICPSPPDVANKKMFTGQIQKVFCQISGILDWEMSRNLFATHILKCRDSDHGELVSFLKEYANDILMAQIDIVRPRCVLVWGTALKYMLGRSYDVSMLRQTEFWVKFDEQYTVPFVFSFHPFMLSKDVSLRPLVWQDYCKATSLAFAGTHKE
ncbi:uracil-DNA glycosylase family protein [Basilea psittacipulmonis]|uniref:Uracil-DNA glycosylase-like domain-containing protein n=1 Tax=Basilea psittacipulmonis DSM 24701 TaxID=1072685 RepID=A0A077DEM4_9BURK|nr:uracil-DNA glycosylase family protein [Basilea psittacipulmonis]AIL33184.1 hypothetical protein IX83_07655 [Basilea psittacipulmonis DSM 24701]